MKTPKELAKEFDNIDFVEFIAKIQKDAYNQAIEDADEAIVKSYNIKTDRYDYNGHNISKLKIK